MAENKLGHNYEDLGPEFDSIPHLAQAAAALEQSTTGTGARARLFLEQARRALHPLTLDPDAHAELASKRAQHSERASVSRDDRDTELAQLREKIKALEQGGSVSVGDGA